LSSEDINSITRKIRKGLDSVTHQREENAIELTKRALHEVFKRQLAKYNNKLSKVLVNSSKLQSSIDNTREQIIIKINALTKINDIEAILKLFGVDLEDKILVNIGIECVSCFYIFKEEHREGEVNKDTTNCKHGICKGCKPTMPGQKCPTCKTEY